MAENDDLLAHRTNEPFDTVAASAAASAVAAAGWIVIVGDDGSPLGATRKETVSALRSDEPVLAALRSGPPTVVADAAISVDGLLDSRVFRSAAPEAVIAVDDEGVQGVWAGADLAAEALGHTSRFGADWSLPGRILVPKIVRICGYTADGRHCSASMEFPERPAELPPWPDPDKVGTHDFVW